MSTMTWQDAVPDILKKKLYVVAEYDERIPTVDPRNSFFFPSVVVSTKYVNRSGHNATFNRENIWTRDMGRCAYCQCDVALRDLTFDHVYPRSLGGPTNWENIVCACQECNVRKANKTCKQAGMTPFRKPHAPTAFELARNARLMGRYAPPLEAWQDYLYWKGALDPH
ncbi:HNH endonuclease [Agrobacterium rubi]|nr:HNH endonuclease [Agrobacterium rubi]NTF24279.1 HNH endonuclease [Agrobacterium rubi]